MQVEQAARRRNDDIQSALQRTDLAVFLYPSKNDGLAQFHLRGIGFELLADLDRQLACRRQNQRPRAADIFLGPRIAEFVQDGQRESAGLAGAGLGDAQHVPALHQAGNGFRLDGCGGYVITCRQGTQYRIGQAEIREFNTVH